MRILAILSNGLYTLLAHVFYSPMSIIPLSIKNPTIVAANGIIKAHQNLTQKDLIIAHLEGFLVGWLCLLFLLFIRDLFKSES